MCGIAGIIMKNGAAPDRTALVAMRAALSHRGPDGGGEHVAGPVGLVHTRLAIIDLAGGDQPLFGPGGGTLVGNGEIYNYVELRAEQAGTVEHRTDADFEPALSRLEARGCAAAADLRGMYAFAMHRPGKDGMPGDVLLARDPFGIKPLYTVETDEAFAFASEPRALFAAGLATPRLNGLKRAEFLQLHYTTGHDTVFAGIERLMPGEALRLSGGAIVERKRLPAIPPAPVAGIDGDVIAPPADMDEAVARFDAAFEESVQVHQRSDVPYGMFLSGGIDSSAILTMMTRLNDRPVLAFTCGFAGTDVPDERPAAQKVVEALGAQQIQIEFAARDLWASLPAIADAFDEPTSDYAILPSWKLAQEARKHVKVVLSGEGGDEIFAGYGRYRKLLRPWWQGGRQPRLKGEFDKTGILRNEARLWTMGLAAIRRDAGSAWPDPLQAAQAADIEGWLPADLLLKLDRALMAHGVEGRTPFLDPVVAKFGFHLPVEFKIEKNLGKAVVRHWLAKHCPAAGAFERKRGFTVPVGEWIAERGAEIGALVASQPCIEEVFRPDAVRDFFRSFHPKQARAAWTLLFYAVWHKRHIEGVEPTGDTFEYLRG
ncbi:MAG: asparagine synthase (glutamine-hydrolyzing) [Bauldia litoralis]